MTSARRGCVSVALASLGTAALGCEFSIPAATYVDTTRLIAVRAEVVELGPLNPARVGLPSDAPIAEPMPHDRFRFEAVVVDPNGEQLAASELESIWLQCGASECRITASIINETFEFDQRCEDVIGLTTDTRCHLGEGDGNFEFQIPELGSLLANDREAKYFGVIAWNGRSVEDCWATRRSRDGLLDNCAFINRTVKVGPSWWLLAYADQVLGLETGIPTWDIPVGVYGQPANRTPEPQVEVYVDGELVGTYPDNASFEVESGSHIDLVTIYDEVAQFAQTYFVAVFDTEFNKFWFTYAQEFLSEVAHTTNAVHMTASPDFLPIRALPFEFVVDELAEPGRSTIFLVHTDNRYGEGVVRLDFEVKP